MGDQAFDLEVSFPATVQFAPVCGITLVSDQERGGTFEEVPQFAARGFADSYVVDRQPHIFEPRVTLPRSDAKAGMRFPEAQIPAAAVRVFGRSATNWVRNCDTPSMAHRRWAG